MLRLFGTSRRMCDGVSRRDLLHVGGLGLWGLTLGDLRATAAHGKEAVAQAAQPITSKGFGKAKACIFVFPFGAQPQHETFDPKPLAPVEVQGEMKAIESSVPGTSFAEGLPQLSLVADKLTVIRSMTHPFPLHCVAYAMTGMPSYTTDVEGKPRDPSLWPYLGSVAEYCWEQQLQQNRNSSRTGALADNSTRISETAPVTPRNKGAKTGVPQHIGLPWRLNTRAEDYLPLAGPYGAFLGQQYDPVWTEFEGQALHVAPKLTASQTREFVDPYGGIRPDCRFVFPGASRLADEVTLDRFHIRQHLLSQLDTARSRVETAAVTQHYSQQQQRAMSLLTSPEVRKALDVTREPAGLRDRYGMTLFGQSCLAARRLIEAGSRFVTVFWDAYGSYFAGAWDTHAHHYPRLKQYLLPGFDPALAALVSDLDERGMLDETLVICMSEHGRTPKIDSKPPGAARHHWSRVYSAVLAGGGTPRGAVVGASDPQGGDVLHTPISPKDLQATAYHLLGIDWRTTFFDRQSRPHPIAGEGRLRDELLA